MTCVSALRTGICWALVSGVTAALINVSLMAVEAPKAVSSGVPESINQEIGPGFYYWDPRIERFVKVNETLQVMDPSLASILRRIYSLEEIISRVHPDEQGLTGP